MKRIKVGIIGVGNISEIYLQNMTTTFGNILEVAGCSDLTSERSLEKSKKYNIKQYKDNEELFSDPEIDIVLNLTNPQFHAGLCLDAVNAGKHVYVEKPFSISRDDGYDILKLAKEKGLLTGCAPDTFLGAGIQTCIKLLDDGWIGTPVGATAFMLCRGHESWHPDPEFYYQVGGGPMLDMGPYYLTALVSMLGGVKRVTGSTKITFPKRTITSQPKYGKIIDVEVPTHVNGILDFENGAIGNIITSFDVSDSTLPRIEIYGSEGTIICPDPNTFGGPVLISRRGTNGFVEIPLTHSYPENSRGLGVADMAYSIVNRRKNRASGELAYHVLDIMQAIHESSELGKHIELTSSCERPEPMPMGLLCK